MSKIKRLAIICICALFSAGCGGGQSPPPTASPASDYDSGYDGAQSEDGLPENDNAASDRMIIKNAYMEIEASDSNLLYSNIISQTKILGGYEASYNIDNYEDYSVINADLRVPSDKFDELIGYISANSKVINNRMSSEDITEEYFDMAIRLETKRATLKTYFSLLEKAESVDEIIQLQRTIDEITLEIEAMEGKLNFWRSQVSMSTISMLIRQLNDPVEIRKDINWNTLSLDDMGYLITRGFTTTADYIAVLAQWLVIVIISISPLLAVAAVLLLVLRKYIGWRPIGKGRVKRGRGKRVEKDSEIQYGAVSAENNDDNSGSPA